MSPPSAPSSSTPPTLPAEIQKQVRAFEAWDRENSPPAAPVLFIGDDDIDHWPTRIGFPRHRVVNRGLTGLTAALLPTIIERLVRPYDPAMIVCAAGRRDLLDGRDPQAVCSDVGDFVKRIRARQPRLPLVILAVKPCPEFDAEIDPQKETARRKTNELLAAMCSRDANLHFVDVSTVLLDPAGHCIRSLFDAQTDRLNATGYRLWSLLLTPTLQTHASAPTSGSATPGRRPSAAPTTPQPPIEYVASKNSKTFHKSTCSAARRITEANLLRFDSREAALRSGRRPCKICNP